jgi:hypothetical protein
MGRHLCCSDARFFGYAGGCNRGSACALRVLVFEVVRQVFQLVYELLLVNGMLFGWTSCGHHDVCSDASHSQPWLGRRYYDVRCSYHTDPAIPLCALDWHPVRLVHALLLVGGMLLGCRLRVVSSRVICIIVGNTLQ